MFPLHGCRFIARFDIFTGLMWLQELVGEAFTWSGGGSNDLVTGYFGDGQTRVGVEKETRRRSNL